MKVGLSWLREYVDLPADLTAADLDLALNNLGIEVEEIHDQRHSVQGSLVVGKVLTVEELTGFKKPIRFCTVDVGQANGTGAPQEIICGARNFAEGDLVVVILPGGVLPGGFEIGARKTYGRNSHGMICSAAELGLSGDHDGIIILPTSVDAAVGDDARAVVGLDDIEVHVTVTPDRGYQMSVRGLARELAHAFKVPFRDPGLGAAPGATATPAWPVTVLDTEGCDRFAARQVRGIDPAAPTPAWMAKRLLTAGVRTLGLAIDITNYVMLELGQPMHAFDADRITGGLVVRRATEGEKLTTLDGQARVLSAEDMVICDDTGPVSLAAVMGGQTSEVVDGTANVLFEAAHWDPTMVGRTARRHRLFSEAAKRWERGVDRQLCLVAIERAVSLLVEHGGGQAGADVLDIDHVPAPVMISMPGDRASRLIGVDYSVDRVGDLLTEIGCDTAVYDDHVDVIPPSWRPDLRETADLVEEVVRLDGFENVPSTLPIAPPGNGLTPSQRRKRTVGRALAEQGYVEVLSYPFVSASVLATLGLPTDGVKLANPLSDEEPLMRTSLLPPLLAALRRNVGRGQRDLALYEQGLVFLPDLSAGVPPVLGVAGRPDPALWEKANASVPAQPWRVAAVLCGEFERSGWWGAGRAASWSDAVQAARDVLSAAAVPAASVTVAAAEKAPWHPGRCAAIAVDGVVVGHAGELHPAVCTALDLPKRACAMELDLDAVPLPGTTPPPVFSTYPPALIDVALVLSASVPAAQVEAALTEGAGPLLESVRLFDVYTSEQLGADQRSLAYKLTFRAPDRTLTVEEAVAARDAAVAVTAERFGAVLRGA
ncbi:phenylalanine--tRNA ligase beta subunit [Catellatospora sp. TT07R-123]|uniref:phenylalanine--tRNA ligase subunit beta n=1 Tax=Catellatospora sp. TT07R-123 TaxID=2733863 RepID=UPI001B17F117|nr:phenylalanine--tRNA ligase subunit beta [Catellatospora sp. TT07R-123]GHJ48501.1 phenylalanine--tRNA ligase beta subunit [Catellatospora sp. TT07R-123]